MKINCPSLILKFFGESPGINQDIFQNISFPQHNRLCSRHITRGSVVLISTHEHTVVAEFPSARERLSARTTVLLDKNYYSSIDFLNQNSS
jgi:hypothetical protein